MKFSEKNWFFFSNLDFERVFGKVIKHALYLSRNFLGEKNWKKNVKS